MARKSPITRKREEMEHEANQVEFPVHVEEYRWREALVLILKTLHSLNGNYIQLYSASLWSIIQSHYIFNNYISTA
jgi:hypothetical protein